MDDQSEQTPQNTVCNALLCNGDQKCKLFSRSLSPQEAAEFLGRDERTVARLRAKGRIRALRLDGVSYRYWAPWLLEDLEYRACPESEEPEPESSAEKPGVDSPKSIEKRTKAQIKVDLNKF